MTTVAHTTEAEIYKAIRARLIRQLPAANERTCWIDDQPLPIGKDAIPDGFSFTISPGDGRFDPGNQIGGSLCAMLETTSCVITIMRRLEMDQAKRLTLAISHDDREAMFIWKQKVLSALLVEYSDNGGASRWQPSDQDGNLLLTSQLMPSQTVNAKRHQNWPLLYSYIVFDFAFTWQLK